MKITAKQYAAALLESLDGKSEKQAGEIIKNFSQVLLNNNHLSKLDGIILSFNESWNKKYNEVEAEIISARAIGKETIAKLKKFIEEKAGSEKISLKESIDKSLLGGVILRYGNKSLDLSLKNKLKTFKEQLIN